MMLARVPSLSSVCRGTGTVMVMVCLEVFVPVTVIAWASYAALRADRTWSVAGEMCEVIERGGSIEDSDRTARLFLDTFREIST